MVPAVALAVGLEAAAVAAHPALGAGHSVGVAGTLEGVGGRRREGGGGGAGGAAGFRFTGRQWGRFG